MFRWALGLLLLPLGLVLLLGLSLYLPPVQRWAVERATAYASEQTGWDIRLRRVSLRFPLDLDLHEVSALTPDTLLHVRHVVVDLDFSRIHRARLGVEAIALEQGTLDTQGLIPTVRLRGRLGSFLLRSESISLRRQVAEVTAATLSRCDLDIQMQDTTIVDTTESQPLPWTLLLGDLRVEDSRVAFRMPGDTLTVSGGLRSLHVMGGRLDLERGIYRIRKAEAEADSLFYDQTYALRLKEGFDYNHIALRRVRLGLEDFIYCPDSLSLLLTEARGVERCGLELSQLTGRFRLDDEGIRLPRFQLATPQSMVQGRLVMPFRALERQGGGRIDVALRASIHPADIVYTLPPASPYLSTAPLSLDVQARGNVDTLHLTQAHLLAEPMLEAHTQGQLTQLLDADRLSASLDWRVRTYDLSRIAHLTGLAPRLRLPQMRLTGHTGLQGSLCDADLRLQEAGGTVDLKGKYDYQTEAYRVTADIRQLQLHHFLPQDSLYHLTARVEAEGRGLDLLSPQTRLSAQAQVDSLAYARHNIGNTRLTALLHQGSGVVELMADNALLKAQACVEAHVSRKLSLANFTLDLHRIDLQALGVVENPFVASMQLHAEGSTNLSDTHRLDGGMRAVTFQFADSVVNMQDLQIALEMAPDTLFTSLQAGDLNLSLYSRQGLDSLLARAEGLGREFSRQLAERRFDQALWRDLLPEAYFSVRSGRNNPVCGFLMHTRGLWYNRLNIDLVTSPTEGLKSRGEVRALNTGAVQLDTIRWTVVQDTAGVVSLDAHVENGPKNRQVVFRSQLAATLTPTGATASIAFYDGRGRKGMDMGAGLEMEEEGLRLHLRPFNPIVAYRKFTLNPDNYIYLRNDRHLEANVDLLADDGTGFKLYTTPNEQALQDITLSIQRFNLGELSAVLPYMPSVQGLLSGDFHLVQDGQAMSLSTDARVDRLVYEGAALGNVGLNAMYLPNADGTHYVDGIVSQGGREVMLLTGTYNPADGGSLDVQAALQRLPLGLVNGFIPDQLLGLRGYAVGEVAITGPASAPVLNGSVQTDSMYLYSEPYSLNLRFPDDTLTIRNSRIHLNRIEAYSTGKRPLVLDGDIDCRRLADIALNLSLESRNFELIRAPKTAKALAYGKVFVDLRSNLTGPLSNLRLRGGLRVLGNTDVTYVLKDSPLSVEDQLAGLVTFVDFGDTLEVAPLALTPPQNIDMQLNINIEQAAQVHCLLSPDGANYVDLEGGGNLLMNYTTQDGLRLSGRYTVVSGTLNYSLMVMALKDCTIRQGSYVEFTGDIMNPKLSLSASERVKTTVYEGGVPRSVNFDVGVNISQTLANMGMEFTLAAPEDLTVSNQLATMGADGRSKAAVTMLATGMYLTDESSASGFSGTNALNSFLQTQISSINSKALRTIDLNFGVDNTNTASGGTQTDYSFSFAKRFWGNRISLVIGGKVSSGSEVQNTGQSIINNVSIEYRLDKSATRYVRVFYDRNTESLMEGEVMEMGAGVVFRRKSTRLGELFIFRNRR